MDALYDKIGINYNETRKADAYLCDRLFQKLAPRPAGTYLDIGCGTGNYAHELQKRGLKIIGIDPSREMLDKAKQKNPHISWRSGHAEKTLLDAASVDGITAFLTTHQWSDLRAAFAEMARVLKPGGRMVIFTSTPVQMRGYWLNHYFPKMLEDSINQMPALEVVEAAMHKAGLEIAETEKYFVRPDLEDAFLYCGKHRPHLYFRPEIRRGISTFAALANREEVSKGLADLEKDINSGDIEKIIAKYENGDGDYLFVTAVKKDAAR